MTVMANLGSLWNRIQTWLFLMLEDEFDELDEKHRKFVAVCELCSPRAPLLMNKRQLVPRRSK